MVDLVSGTYPESFGSRKLGLCKNSIGMFSITSKSSCSVGTRISKNLAAQEGLTGSQDTPLMVNN
jgi:hypothetical protein